MSWGVLGRSLGSPGGVRECRGSFPVRSSESLGALKPERVKFDNRPIVFGDFSSPLPMHFDGFWRVLGAAWGCVGGVLGGLGGAGVSSAVLWGVLGGLGVVLGRSWVVLGSLWGRPEASWGILGRVLGGSLTIEQNFTYLTKT